MRLPTTALCLAIGAAGLLGIASCGAHSETGAAPGVDLSRLAGRWYLIARLPSAGEHRGLAAQVEYRVKGAELEESYSAHSGALDGPVETSRIEALPDPAQPTHWRVKDGWMGSKERVLLYVSPGYRRAIVGDDSRNAAWVLAREPEIPEWSLDGMLARLSMRGFDVSKLRRVPQKAEQVGKPGFE